MNPFSYLRSSCCLILLSATLFAADNLVPEGSFPDAGGPPKGWAVPAGQPEWMLSRFSSGGEDHHNFLRCDKAPGIIEITKPINPTTTEKISVTYDFRLQGFARGTNDWDVPCLEINFRDAAGVAILDYTAQKWESKDTDTWIKRSEVVKVPTNATSLFIALSYKASSGKADWANIVVTAAK